MCRLLVEAPESFRVLGDITSELPNRVGCCRLTFITESV
jgi:hypothetical protein